MSQVRGWVLDAVTVVVAVAAIGIGWTAFTRPPGPGEEVDREVDDFEAMTEEGNRVGASDPTVTVVVWYDYECPVCRSVEPGLEELVTRYPDDVAVVYRHYPLSYHAYAYPASVAVECAADQGAFAAFHGALFESEEWMAPGYRDKLVALGDSLGLDIGRFTTCFDDASEAHPRIEADIDVARSFAVRGTPAIVVDGVYLAGMPQSLELEEWQKIGSASQ